MATDMIAIDDVKHEMIEFARKNFDMWRQNPGHRDHRTFWFWLGTAMADFAAHLEWLDTEAVVIEIQTQAKRATGEIMDGH